MKVEILYEVQQDLIDCFRFYERQSEGLGDYFLDSLFSDIDSLQLYAGIHALHFGYHLSTTTVSRMKRYEFVPFWFADRPRHGFWNSRHEF